MSRFKFIYICMGFILLFSSTLFTTKAVAADLTMAALEERIIGNHSNYKKNSLKIVDSTQISGVIQEEENVNKPYEEPIELSEAQLEEVDELSKSLLALVEGSKDGLSITNEEELLETIKETVLQEPQLEMKEKVIIEKPGKITAAVVTYETVKSDFVTFDHQEVYFYDNDNGIFLSKQSVASNEELTAFAEKYKDPVGSIGLRTTSSIIVTVLILAILLIPFLISGVTSRSRSSYTVTPSKKYNA